MEKIDSILAKVLKAITPSAAEQKKIEAVTNLVMKVTEKVIRPHALTATLAGSFTRNTWMPHKREFDVFILFPENVPREQLEKLGLEYGQEIVKRLKGHFKIAYAEHPYVRSKILYNGTTFDIDIVPCYKVASAEKIKSAVDRTPFHNQWLSQNLKPEQTGQVRLLKQFTKVNNLYGSDTKVQGFSGYLCELLIVYYGSFKSFVKEAAKWKAGDVFIDPGKRYKTEQIEQIKKQFKGQPLIVIDPVDPKRNVAAVLSPENFIRLVKICSQFLQKPTKNFFFRVQKTNIKKLAKLIKRRQTQFIAISFKSPDIIPDILWPQLRRTAARIADILKEYEFSIFGWDVWSNSMCIMLFEIEKSQLPFIRKIHGPDIFAHKRADEFIKKYKPLGRIYVEGDHWVAEIVRKFRTAKSKLKDSLAVDIKELLAKGFASHIAQSITKGFKLLNEKQILNLAKREHEFCQFLDNYLTKDYR
jgi:tRNA nucleotidyltransferase (CCA-adding enzyme)